MTDPDIHERLSNADWWLENFRFSGDKVLLHGIDLEKQDGEWCPVIPYLGPLCDLGRDNPVCQEFQWLCEDNKWVCVRV